MFITRATRHDETDRAEFFKEHEWDHHSSARKKVSFIARDGGVVGNVSLIEIDPQTLVLEDVLVHKDRRGEGIGRGLIQAAMNSRGGRLYLCCHDDTLGFYDKFGFTEQPFDELPDPIKEFMIEDEAAPNQLAPGHVHHFLTAR